MKNTETLSTTTHSRRYQVMQEHLVKEGDGEAGEDGQRRQDGLWKGGETTLKSRGTN